MKPSHFQVILGWVCIGGLVSGAACMRPRPAGRTESHPLALDAVHPLRQFLHYAPGRPPVVSAHRGGPAAGFPENCLATFANTLRQVPALIEFDVQLSADDSLVVIHDNTLDRTSTGTGPVRSHTYAQLRQLRLEDPAGRPTPYTLPTLGEVLRWGRGKTLLTVDVKRGVPAQRIVEALQRHRAQEYALIITYTPEQLQQYHRLDSTLSFSVNVENMAQLARLEASGVPLTQVLAFVGLAEPPAELYAALHRRGVKCMLGTMRLEGRNPDPALYRDLARRGADVFATDHPVRASPPAH